jgi:mannan endo-1,4-beta-mannosidase
VAAVVLATMALAACTTASQGAASGGASHGKPSPKATVTTPTFSMAQILDPPSGKYFGVEASGSANSLAPVEAFAQLTGRQPDLIGQYVAWNSAFDTRAAQNAWSYGALYYMAWEPFDTTVADIAAGDSNNYITDFADQVKAAGVPVALSFGHEMNGNWYPWGTTGATPANFVAAWRLIHAIFAAAGADNVIWVWNPNVITATEVPLQPYYPGDSYVDWIGLTGYFPMSGPTTFGQLFGSTMTEIRGFTHKPFIIVETAVQSGPNETGCVRSLVSGVVHSSDVLGFVWFEYDKQGVDWSLASRPAVRDALARAVMNLSIADLSGT